MAVEKARYGVFLVYPESAPENWFDQLKESMGSYAISPLHEPGDGEKPHYHVIYRHGNPITLECMERLIPDGVAANGHVQLCNHPRNYARYLIHLDDPDKQQFEGPGDITLINGYPLDLSRDYSRAELMEFRARIFELIRDFDIFEYSDLLDYLLDHDHDLLDYASNHTILFNTYISSRRNKAIEQQGE